MNERKPDRPARAGDTSPPRLLEGRRLGGANIHHRTGVFVQRVAPGVLAGLDAAAAGPDFGARFVARFTGLQPLRLWPSLSAEVIAALEGNREVPLVEVLLHAVVAVERSVACIMRRMEPLEFARLVRSEAAPGVVELVWESHSASLSRAAARAALVGLVELLPRDLGAQADEPGRDFDTRWAALRRRAERRQRAPTTAVIALAAKRRGIPHEVLAGNYVRLGEGVLQQVVSESVLGSESRTESAAVPEVRTPPPWWKFGRQRLHRFLVLDSRVVSALRIDTPVVTGDGASTVEELVGIANDRARRDGRERAQITLDAALRGYLEEQGLQADAVPRRGRRIALEGVTAIEQGAIPVDVTEKVHDDVRHAVTVAVAERGWSHAVVDFRTANIARSSKWGRGRVTRIEPWPELFLHALPGLARSAEVSDAALDVVFPPGATGRIPAALVVGHRGTMALARSLDRHLRGSRAGVGLALRDRTTIEGRIVDPTLVGRRGGVEFLLRDPRVAAVISAVSPRRVCTRGLRFEHCGVIAFLDPEPGRSAGEYRAALEVGLAAATDTIVIGADNPHVEFVLDSIEPARVLLVATRRRHPTVARHLASKGAVVLPRPARSAESVELRRGGRTVATIPVGSLRRSTKAPGDRALRRVLYTAALAFGLAPAPAESATDWTVAAPEPVGPPEAEASVQDGDAAGSPGARRASRPDGSYPSAGAGLDDPYRSRH